MRLVRDLPSLAVPLVLVVGHPGPCRAARRSASRPGAAAGRRIVDLPGLGHLAHEERPAEVAELIIKLSGSRAQ